MKKIILSLGVLFIILLVSNLLDAQCPMCKLSTESNLSNGGSAGKSLNSGILYMFAAPYLVVGTIAFIWIKNRKKNFDDGENHNDIKFSDN